jgi:hypothetical protein
MDAVTLLKRAAEFHAWESVPDMVVGLYKEASPIAQHVRRVSKALPHLAESRVYWDARKKTLNISLPDAADAATENAWSNRLQNVRGVTNLHIDREWVPQDNVEIKLAAALGWIGNTWRQAEGALGGPNPLTQALVGSLVGGVGGYGTGALLEHLFPERFIERGKLRKTLGLGGAVAGALPGIYKGNLYGRVDGTGTMQGMVTSDAAPVKQASWEHVWARGCRLLDRVELPPRLVKLAENFAGLGGGGMDIPSVPVDAFNHMVWRDARKGVQSAEQNPYGTKSPWGTNQQQLHTPPPVAAATTGLLSGIGQQMGARMLAPSDIVRGIAGAGVGLATATLAGKTLGALGGLTPHAQEQLQNVGVFAGLLTTVIPPLFGY